jgi:hypothetical protein
MQHTYQANLASNESRISCEQLESCGAGSEKDVVNLLLMPKGKCPKRCGEGEGEEEVWDRQPKLLLSFEPPLGIVLLAFGAVAILAGVVAVLDLLAVRANVNVATKHLGAAALDIPHRPAVAGRHAAPMLLLVCRTMLAEDLRQLYHARLSINLLMVSSAWTSVLRVKCV